MQQGSVRNPVAAGQFYPGSAQELKQQIAAFINKEAKKRDCIACVLPHAGYIYSGLVAAETISCVNIKENVILLGPNHTGRGAAFGIMSSGSWKTPLGETKINNRLARAILERAPLLKDDLLAHSEEHSLEVELPFLQYLRKDCTIIPIVFLTNEFESLKQVGRQIASAVRDLKIQDKILVIASTDLTHYESQESAQMKDREVIGAILALDEDRLVKKIQQLNISMCGYAPVIAMISLAKALGAKGAELVKYQTSGDATQDYSSVVGYAGIIIY